LVRWPRPLNRKRRARDPALLSRAPPDHPWISGRPPQRCQKHRPGSLPDYPAARSIAARELRLRQSRNHLPSTAQAVQPGLLLADTTRWALPGHVALPNSAGGAKHTQIGHPGRCDRRRGASGGSITLPLGGSSRASSAAYPLELSIPAVQGARIKNRILLTT
jgi:hypothetical protein